MKVSVVIVCALVVLAVHCQAKATGNLKNLRSEVEKALKREFSFAEVSNWMMNQKREEPAPEMPAEIAEIMKFIEQLQDSGVVDENLGMDYQENS